jgi:hypothetical protein
MGRFFENPLHDEFGSWPLGYTATGGPDVGLIAAVGAAVGSGDDTAFHAAWMAAGDRLAAEAAAAQAKGHRASAAESWLAAAACYATSYHPLYGTPVDPRLVAAFRIQIAAFENGLVLLPDPARPLRIPCEGTTLPGYFLPAHGRAEERRPLVIFTNGYDATVTEMYFALAVPASRRGYHCLIFDGPGQGAPLIEQGLSIRPDWEAVIRPVVDFALTLPGVDPDRLALSGWSLGGYLALRGASGEPRLAACVADPGLRAVLTPEVLRRFGLDDAQIAGREPIPEAAARAVTDGNPHMHWSIVQRGFWVHGVTDLAGFVAAGLQFTLEGRIGLIRCPTLLTTAEDDPLSQGAPALHNELACPKTLLRFTAAEGAGDHCEMAGRSLANRRILDWLHETLGP